MDNAEKIAKAFLLSRGCNDLAHEPDGNVPPDFSVGATIGVEVRRLNQADWSTGRPAGLEIVTYPLVDRVKSLLSQFNQVRERSYWVSFSFIRPLAPWKKICPSLKRDLLKVVQTEPNCSISFRPDPSIEFRIDPTSTKQDQLFNFGAVSDMAAGGAVVAEMIKHIDHYVAEKSAKIEPFRSRYESWWLVLVDYIGYGLRPDDQTTLRLGVQKVAGFNKVYVVSPHSPYVGYEI